MNGFILSKEREYKDGNDEGRSRKIDLVFYFIIIIKELILYCIGNINFLEKNCY